jgi:plasmid stabilization system protein ParE
MLRPVRISSDAVEDLNDGFAFYEAQSPGLGQYFLSCLRADIDGLQFFAGIHRVVYGDFRKALSKVFPFGVFYTVEEGCVVVWAVVDLRRDPERIRRRLSG